MTDCERTLGRLLDLYDYALQDCRSFSRMTGQNHEFSYRKPIGLSSCRRGISILESLRIIQLKISEANITAIVFFLFHEIKRLSLLGAQFFCERSMENIHESVQLRIIQFVLFLNCLKFLLWRHGSINLTQRIHNFGLNK